MTDNGQKAQTTFWRSIALMMIGICGTGLVGWIVFGVDALKKSELDEFIKNRSPYLHDRPHLEERFKAIERALDRMEVRLEKLRKNSD